MSKTVSQLEAEGYTHIECWCEPCRMTVMVAFSMIRKTRPMLPAMRFDDLGAKMRCSRCGRPATRFSPHRQSDMPGYSRGGYPKY